MGSVVALSDFEHLREHKSYKSTKPSSGDVVHFTGIRYESFSEAAVVDSEQKSGGREVLSKLRTGWRSPF